MLDVGCGTGILIEQLLRLNKDLNLNGLDLSEDMLHVAKQKFANNAHVKLHVSSAVNMPFKDNSFDYVTCVQSFHHHPDSLQSLREMRRVLKSKGKLLLIDNSLDGFLRIVLHKLEQRLHPERETDIFRYTKQQMKDLFQKAGFKNIQQQHFWYFLLITVGEKY